MKAATGHDRFFPCCRPAGVKAAIGHYRFFPCCRLAGVKAAMGLDRVCALVQPAGREGGDRS